MWIVNISHFAVSSAGGYCHFPFPPAVYCTKVETFKIALQGVVVPSWSNLGVPSYASSSSGPKLLLSQAVLSTVWRIRCVYQLPIFFALPGYKYINKNLNSVPLKSKSRPRFLNKNPIQLNLFIMKVVIGLFFSYICSIRLLFLYRSYHYASCFSIKALYNESKYCI